MISITSSTSSTSTSGVVLMSDHRLGIGLGAGADVHGLLSGPEAR